MQIFRFDPEVSVPIDEFGSRFKIGPLTGDHTRARVQVMHLPADGLIGRHPTAIHQLFAVVAGEAEVSGTDGVFRTIGPGFAALWVPGEEHETRSADGCTAICIEGTFEMWATAVTKDIVVVDHDPAWAVSFAQLRDRMWVAIEPHAVRVDHIGSTAVRGLAAKPIIDMDIVVTDESKVRPVIQALRPLGYQWRGDLGVEGRQALRYLADDLPEHHLYVVVDGNRAHQDHVLLRDLLREDAEARERYGSLKRQNVELAAGDMDRYIALKDELVRELLTRARAARDQ